MAHFGALQVSAVVAAGDGKASKAIYGQSKAYLEVGGRALVAHVVAALQRVPEVSEVWVVGDAERLAAVLGDEKLRAELTKPLHVLPQFRNLYENAWESYRRLLPGAGQSGRDPGQGDLDVSVLYLSADLPFATPQEISAFVRRSAELDIGYALGLVTEESMAAFYPPAPGEPGIRMASYNLREGRYRQSNLHLVKPGRLVNRHYVEAMYENRYQREFGSIVALAWRLLRDERGGPSVLFYYGLMHLASFLNLRGFRRLADVVRRWIPMARVEVGCSGLLKTSYRFVVTELGGCALDIDNEHDLDVARLRYDEWTKSQHEVAARLRDALPENASGPAPKASEGSGGA